MKRLWVKLCQNSWRIGPRTLGPPASMATFDATNTSFTTTLTPGLRSLTSKLLPRLGLFLVKELRLTITSALVSSSWTTICELARSIDLISPLICPAISGTAVTIMATRKLTAS